MSLHRLITNPLAGLTQSHYTQAMTNIFLPRALIALLAAASLSACTTPETRLRTGLMDAGLSQPMASCMAQRMTDRLSVTQLRRLSALAKTGELDPRRTSYDKLMHHIRALGDPEILQVTGSAALGCSLGG